MMVEHVAFMDAVEDVSRGNRKVPKSDLQTSGPLAVVDQGRQLVAGFTHDMSCQVATPGALIVFGDHTRILKLVDFPFAMGADGVKVLRAKSGFRTKFIYHFLRSRNLSSEGYARHFKFLKRIDIPRMSLEEQDRIVEILDRSEVVLARRGEVVQNLEHLVLSIFREMFGPRSSRAVTDRKADPTSQGWSWTRLDEVAELATGHTPDRGRPEYWQGDIPWVSLPEIRRLDGKTVNDPEIRVTRAGIDNSSAVLLPEGTVCFSRTASVGFVTKLGRPMATSQDFHNWVPGPEIDSTYLMTALRASRSHLLSLSDGSIHKTIYQRVARRFRVLIPPLDLQQEFARRANMIDMRLVAAYRGLDMGEALHSSLEVRAFRGEL